MKSKPEDLLLELAFWIGRHSADDFAKLASLIEEEGSRAQILSFLNGISRLRQTVKKPRRDGGNEKQEVLKFGPTSSPSIKQARARLLHASLNDLRDLATRAGLKVSTKDSRKRLVTRILRAYTPATPKKKGAHSAAPRRNDYSHWASIILGKE